ncbi:hypothetical protein SAMN04244573_04232 [Azotobacter beijerinckii]|uniref:Uncharacterized protein n=1 Tax=Azotobacter beijerinckii TaxID=170623 RepID=A0A1H9RQH4_9GAMM|nr:hypothetical protein [Azotobacter beijerinckii]SER74956.1 hypothetical protein SAMN04244573_04232 [Azotobacter beijerinckii]
MHGGKLTSQDHKAMDRFIIRVLEAYRSGEITQQSAASGIAHVMAALDISNTQEAVAWFNQKGVEYFKNLDDFPSKA